MWKETLRVYKDMLEAEGWNSQTIIDVPAIQRVTFKVSSIEYNQNVIRLMSQIPACYIYHRSLWIWAAFLLERATKRPRREHVSSGSLAHCLGEYHSAHGCTEVVLEAAYFQVSYSLAPL